ncbi:MAG: CbtA family protein [Rhizobiaceae bacterium]
MNVRILLAALLAGVLGGVFATAAQSVKVVPLIMAAEQYEAGTAASDSHSPGTTQHDTSGHDHGSAPAGDRPGLERIALTTVSNILVGVAFSLLLTAGVLITNQGMDFRSGLAWGLAGFVTFVLAPNLGLPPELPGTVAADLQARQIWWLVTVVCTAAGLGIFAFLRNPLLMVAGISLIVAPHLYGAPQPDQHGSLAPASLTAEFVVASIATAFAYWIFLGGVLGWLLERASKREGMDGRAA